jgi:hypothetical protein
MVIAVEYPAEGLIHYAGWQRASAPACVDSDSPFARLLGNHWLHLPPAIRRRFLRKVAVAACVTYAGEVAECRMSLAGWLLAQAARLIGAPLPLGTDTGVSASVSITADAEGSAQYWTRQYARRYGFPQVIHSAKRFSGPTGLEEYLGLGIGIALRLEEAGGALFFVSDHYFWKLGGLRLRIPETLPGHLVVGHTDLGGGHFAFTLDLVHPWLGELVHQLAVFADPPEMAA